MTGKETNIVFGFIFRNEDKNYITKILYNNKNEMYLGCPLELGCEKESSNSIEFLFDHESLFVAVNEGDSWIVDENECDFVELSKIEINGRAFEFLFDLAAGETEYSINDILMSCLYKVDYKETNDPFINKVFEKCKSINAC